MPTRHEDFITLSCPSCNGQLQITENIDKFACGYCGNEHIVKRSGGIVVLKQVEAKLEKIQGGVDRTASELAMQRLGDEMPVTEKKLKEIASNINAMKLKLELHGTGKKMNCYSIVNKSWSQIMNICRLEILLFIQYLFLFHVNTFPLGSPFKSRSWFIYYTLICILIGIFLPLVGIKIYIKRKKSIEELLMSMKKNHLDLIDERTKLNEELDMKLRELDRHKEIVSTFI
ncbi:MAG: hypothetical protein L3J71_14975 [Victivallaceae bacterium]|nr:hypothetical protein [Victivallaceae bacterium]